MVSGLRSMISVALLLTLASPTLSGAAKLDDAAAEWAFLTGYGITHRGFGDTRTQVQTFDAILRYGRFLSHPVGQGWYRGRHELFLELPLHVGLDREGRSMTGGYILGSWKFTEPQPFLPYLFAGGGILFNDLGVKTQGTRLNYSYQGGCGVQYLVTGNTAIGMEYRYHHVSNAGTAEPNEPLNSGKILFGISFFR